ncbi:hypothetical protein ACKKBF_B02920 [Auxenochlorella protothecoides x Auxenochlorella symbiontica]
MGPAIPKTLDDIYNDYTIRREALLTALTDDATEFYEACDPGKDNLCLYGHADGNWTVDLPADEVPPELPEPVLGINFARDGMERRDWMALCAVHSDAWLMSVLFFYAARFDDSGRAELFSLVNQHPTVYEVVTGRVPRTKINKRKQPVYGKAYAGAMPAPASRGTGAGPTGRLASRPRAEQQAPAADRPLPTGRKLTYDDVSQALVGRQAELYWPDDGKWYLVEIHSVDPDTMEAKVQYATGEFEALDFDEVIPSGHMSLLAG